MSGRAAARFGVVLLAAAAALDCGPKAVPRPTAAAPSFVSPAAAIPGDLDVAVRVDLAKIRAVLGAGALEALRKATAGSGATGDAATESLLADAMARADTVWIAFRPAERPELTDSVVVLRGKLAGIDPRGYPSQPPWHPPADLGGGWSRWDRDPPRTRAAPARIYSRVAEAMVFVSTAELDSVERRLELGEEDPHLEPADQGVLSLDARATVFRSSLVERWPSVARVASRLTRARLSADLEPSRLTAELELTADSAEGAKQTALVLGAFAEGLVAQGGLTARVARGLRIEAVSDRAVTHLVLPGEDLAAVLACAGGGACD